MLDSHPSQVVGSRWRTRGGWIVLSKIPEELTTWEIMFWSQLYRFSFRRFVTHGSKSFSARFVGYTQNRPILVSALSVSHRHASASPPSCCHVSASPARSYASSSPKFSFACFMWIFSTVAAGGALQMMLWMDYPRVHDCVLFVHGFF
jgi:hypothetical protein